MTDKELTIWEHLDSVMRVLTSKEMGAWLYRRDKRVLATELEKIKAEIEDMWIKSAKDLRTGEVIYENLCEHSEVLDILNKHIFELKGEKTNPKGVLEQIAEEQKTLLDTTKAWSKALEHGDIY